MMLAKTCSRSHSNTLVMSIHLRTLTNHCFPRPKKSLTKKAKNQGNFGQRSILIYQKCGFFYGKGGGTESNWWVNSHLKTTSEWLIIKKYMLVIFSKVCVCPQFWSSTCLLVNSAIYHCGCPKKPI